MTAALRWATIAGVILWVGCAVGVLVGTAIHQAHLARIGWHRHSIDPDLSAYLGRPVCRRCKQILFPPLQYMEAPARRRLLRADPAAGRTDGRDSL